jgi:hypothetical protein
MKEQQPKNKPTETKKNKAPTFKLTKKEFEKTQKWFEIEGKTDTTNLGC